MKLNSRFAKIAVCTAIFLTLVTGSNLLVRPLYNKIGKSFEKIMNSLAEKSENDLNFTFSYSSLSPSILRGISINDVVLTDTQSGLVFAQIRRLSVRYSIPDFFKGGALAALKSVTVRDVKIALSEGENDFWLKPLLSRREKSSSLISSEALEKIDLSFFDLIRAYCVDIVYNTPSLKFEGVVDKAVLTTLKSASRNDVMTDARVEGNFALIHGLQKFAGDVNFNALVPSGINGASGVLRFANLASGQVYADDVELPPVAARFSSDYRIRYMGFLAEYKNTIFNMRMLPGMQNFFMEFNAALDTGDLAAHIFTDNFTLSRIVELEGEPPIARFFDTRLSLDVTAQYNVSDGLFSYNSNGDVFLPSSVFPSEAYADDVLISYSLSGDEGRIEVPYLIVNGERYNLSYEGSLNLKTVQPEGTLYIDSLVFPNGGEISSEVYIEPTSYRMAGGGSRGGFMLFSPQILVGDRTLTAAELNVMPKEEAWDFTFEVFDYSHEEAERPGQFSLYGSVNTSNLEVQTSVSFDTIYLDSLVLLYSFFAKQELQGLLERAASFVSTFVFSCDSFASIEGGDYAFNVPYAIMANTVRDDQLLILAANGNRDNINLSRLEFVFARQRLTLDADLAQLTGGRERVVTGRLELNDIPYNFNGLFAENWMSLNSEYGFQLALNTDTSGAEAVLTGVFSAAEFPLRIGERIFTLRNETTFSYSVGGGINVDIPYFEGHIMGDSLNPSLSFSANIDPNGCYFKSISYSDVVSTLSGNGNVFWMAEGSRFDGATFEFDIGNEVGLESITLKGDVVNPLEIPLGMPTIFSGELARNLFMTASLNVEALRSKRFVFTSRETDTINAYLSMQGSLSNPFVTFSMPSAMFTIQNTPLIVTASATLEDLVARAYDVSVDFGTTQVKDFTASIDLRQKLADLKFMFESELLGEKIITDVSAHGEPLGEEEITDLVPKSMSLSFEAVPVSIKKGRRAKKRARGKSYILDIIKSNDDLIISSSDNIGLSGIISKYSDISIQMRNPLPLEFNIEGTVSRNDINLICSDIRANLPRLVASRKIADLIKVYKGLVVGGFAVTGSPNAPYFAGTLDIVPAEFNFPSFFKRKAETEKITLLMSGSQFYTEPTRCRLHKTPVDVTVNVQMNRLAFDSLDVRVQTVGNNYAPININLPQIHIKGDVMTDLNVNYSNDLVSVTGEITAKNANAELGATRLNEMIAGLTQMVGQQQEAPERINSVDVALDIKAQSRVQISYATFLRAVVVPGSEIAVTYFGEQDRLLLDGDVPIRSGEISYLNTNFYIKEGSIHFSDNDESFDPRVTVRAETKAYDSMNEPVNVELLVDNQYLSQLSPRLNATPVKSEREIMELLGGILTGNSESAATLALSTGDYAIQSVFTRRLENFLRDFLNFDIVSFRTLIVQNAVRQSVERNSDNSNLAGNYFDGMTVYIGKYFNDTIFGDVMATLNYDQNRVDDNFTRDGYTAGFEAGFELDSPFANIRFSLSPSLEDLVNLRLVQNTALTLSWKFNF